MTMTMIALPRPRQLQRSLIFCLLLLLSICCSATDSFQPLQLDYSVSSKRQRTTKTVPASTPLTSTSINTAAVGVYGCAASASAVAVVDTAASTSTIVVDRKRRWRNIFEPENRTTKRHQEQQHQQQQQQRRQRRRRSRVALLDDEEYQRRKQEWADRYATLDGLRATFGSNKNKLYGDLDATTTRKLYKSLLPTAVCELVLELLDNNNANANIAELIRPEELAELAFETRKAAKLYARERCHVPARLLANWYDGFRAFKRYGRFQTEGMSYDQLFDKYYRRTLSSTSTSTQRNGKSNSSSSSSSKGDDHDHDHDWTEEDIVTQTCMKILESACRTNPLVDQMTLEKRNNKKRGKNSNNNTAEREDLEKIAQTLEDDVRKLLDPYNN